MQKQILFTFLGIIIGALGMYVFLNMPQLEETVSDIKDAYNPLQAECESRDGKWIQQHSECDFGGDTESRKHQSWCEQNGGRFATCASACRNVTDPYIACGAVCVNVCNFDISS